jgi:nucleotide-binding universal stress UspA family protein
MRPIRTILVAVDFSRASILALDEAIDLAATVGARVVVLHAYQLSPMAAPIVGSWQLSNVIGARSGRGVEIVPALRNGRPREQIQIVAEQVGADLIVLGTHDRHHAWETVLHGNVATAVLREARTPVLTLRGGDH